MQIKTEQVISSDDWDALVTETYNRPYCFQQQDGCKERGREYVTVQEEPQHDYPNDTVPEVVNHGDMGVSFAAWLARDPTTPLEGREDTFGLMLWWNRNFYPSVEMVASDLCKRGLLKAGEYTIDIDW